MGRMDVVEAEWAASERAVIRPDTSAADLAALWGPAVPRGRAPRILGLFAHPDDEVFCVGGTIARCAEAGAVTGLVSLTRGDAGQIRDARTATRRTLGTVRVKELEASASALGVDHVTCLDLGDGRLEQQPIGEIAATVRELVEEFAPDVVVTFGVDGGFGHPDHVASCLATIEALRGMAERPRLLHAKFSMPGQLMVDIIVEWLTSKPLRFRGSAEFGHALKLFADGTSMLGVAADHVRIEWFPPGSFIIEQDEPAADLFCILSGTADVVAELDDGRMQQLHTARAGCFVGEDGLRSGLARNAHVIARDAVTCLVLSRERPSQSAGRGFGASLPPLAPSPAPPAVEDCLMVDVKSTLDRKVAALAAHRSQYALAPDLLPMSLLRRLLGTEHFV
ncbi:MAG: PIG-L family deacetylase, partial [Acidimicrobiales bacterium]